MLACHARDRGFESLVLRHIARLRELANREVLAAHPGLTGEAGRMEGSSFRG
jgi:hypothetical protein